jgi:hypothetical protein
MARCHPRASKVVMGERGKVCEVPFRLRKEGSKSLVEWGKLLKEIRLRVGSSWAAQASLTEM